MTYEQNRTKKIKKPIFYRGNWSDQDIYIMIQQIKLIGVLYN